MMKNTQRRYPLLAELTTDCEGAKLLTRRLPLCYRVAIGSEPVDLWIIKTHTPKRTARPTNL